MDRLTDIYQSFRRLHSGTQAWMMLVLGPGIFWPPLLALVAWHVLTNGVTGGAAEVIYLINAAILSISLVFDIRDTRRWSSGARAIA